MSKQNAVNFLNSVNTNKTLREKLLDGAASSKAWVTAAATAGFEVTVDELRSVAEQLAGKALTADNFVGALRGMFEVELSDAELSGVAGGAAVASSSAPPPVSAKVAAQLGALASGGLGEAGGGSAYHVKEGGPMFPKDGSEFGADVINVVNQGRTR
jgi:predicted ribosomally synthesized peptide with nif11-like leader